MTDPDTCSQNHIPSLTTPGGNSPDCPACGRPRCWANRNGNRCRGNPVPGLKVCASHGGRAPGGREKSNRYVLEREIKAGVFWDGDAPLLDPGEALVKIASRLHRTAEKMSQRLDDQMEAHDELVENGVGACECCGYDATHGDPVNDQTLEIWKFAIKETASIMNQIQRIGLADRALRLQEGQAQLVISGMMAAFDALQLSEEDQIKARDAMVKTMLRLEEAPGMLDDPQSHVPALLNAPAHEPERVLKAEQVPNGPGPRPDAAAEPDDLSWLS